LNGTHNLAAVARDTAGNLATSLPITVTVDNVSDTTPPTIAGVNPVDGAIDVALDVTVTVTFDEAMDPASINATTIELRDAANQVVSAAVGYDIPSHAASLAPATALAHSTQYTTTVKGGTTDPRVKDLAGNALSSDYIWSFTTEGSSGSNCPCSIWDDTTTPATPSTDDASPVELGVKFQADVGGYITAIRFYKGPSNTGTHIGNLWSSDGTLLGTATFTNETASGWQQVSFATPVQITANTTYVASYHTEVGFYAADGAYFAAGGFDKPPLRALANGIDGGNGVYVYGPSAFPTSSYNASNYWVDVVFATSLPPDTTPPTVSVTNPVSGTVVSGTLTITADASDNVGVVGVQFLLDGANLGTEDTVPPYSISWDSTTATNGVHQLAAIARDEASNSTTSSPVNVTVDNDTTPPTIVGVNPVDGAIDVALAVTVTVTFDEAIDPATISTSTIELRDGANHVVPAIVSYDVLSQTAKLIPTTALTNSARYTATVKGGTTDPRVKDLAGNALANDYTWSFTTIAPNPPVMHKTYLPLLLKN
jgi:hypothetical protein